MGINIAFVLVHGIILPLFYCKFGPSETMGCLVESYMMGHGVAMLLPCCKRVLEVTIHVGGSKWSNRPRS